MKTNYLLLSFLLIVLVVSSAFAAEESKHKPARKDKCPVCGMFVYQYENWLAEIAFADGTVFFFDGVKDLLKFYNNPEKYAPQNALKDIERILVTEYYSLQMIDAKKAYYVIGSDIYGPMGRELIPFLTEEDAEVFLKDHRGRKVIRFGDITPSILKKLD